MDLNPYASPQAVDEPQDALTKSVFTGEDCHVTGDLIVTPCVSSLPERCYLCNRPAAHVRRIKCWAYLSLIRGSAWRIAINSYVCVDHRQRWRLFCTLIALGSIAVVVPTLVATATLNLPMMIDAALFWGVIIIFAIAIKSLESWAGPALTIKKVRDGRVWLRGARAPFLESLKRDDEAQN